MRTRITRVGSPRRHLIPQLLDLLFREPHTNLRFASSTLAGALTG